MTDDLMSGAAGFRPRGVVRWSRARRTAVVIVDGALAVGVGAVGGLWGGAPAGASGGGTAPTPGWTGLQVPPPFGLNPPNASPGEQITAVGCASAVSCAAAGSYADASSNGRGILAAQSGGSWSAVEAPLPSDAATTDPDPSFYDMACPSNGSCVGVGIYESGTGGTSEGLIETLSGGVWNATEAPVPSDAQPSASAHNWAKSVSCPAPGDCTVVGYYDNTMGHQVGFIDTLSGGQWSTMVAPQVSDADTNNQVTLVGVSCPSVGNCTADAEYETNAGGEGLELLTDSGGNWSPSVAPIPSDAATGSSQRLELPPSFSGQGQSLSCSLTQCAIVGGYVTTSGGFGALVAHGSAATWATTGVPLPNDAAMGASTSAFLDGVSCGFDGGCAGVGQFQNTSHNELALVASVSPSGVVSGQEAPQPQDAVVPPANPDANLNSVSCLSSTDCTAVGFYDSTTSPSGVALIDTLSGTTWSAQPGAMPRQSAGGAGANSSLDAVTCSGRGACAAGGWFLDTGTNQQGLLNTYTPPEGYWTDASDGGVFSYGAAQFHGSAGSLRLNAPVVGMAATPGSGGYWEVATDGGIFNYGDAPFLGSRGGQPLNKPIVGMASTPNGQGYWLVASDGGIFNYGDAGFFGSAGSLHLNAPVVGMAATPDGGGYWLVASDGGIFTYGDAVFFGSRGGQPLNKPVVGMAASVTGQGYWLVASDGGIFTYGDALFQGSTGSIKLNKPIVSMMSTFDGAGYWLVASDGGIFNYGDAGFSGSAGSLVLNKPMVNGAPS